MSILEVVGLRTGRGETVPRQAEGGSRVSRSAARKSSPSPSRHPRPRRTEVPRVSRTPLDLSQTPLYLAAGAGNAATAVGETRLFQGLRGLGLPIPIAA
jgi:hypothetical protein